MSPLIRSTMKSSVDNSYLCITITASARGRDHVQFQQDIARKPKCAASLIRLPLARPPVLLRLIAEVHEQRLGVVTCRKACPGRCSVP